jgi:hypothetical protein
MKMEKRVWSEMTLPHSMAEGCGFGEPPRLDIPPRRLTEETVVFAGKLTGALISDVENGSRGIHSLDEHFLSKARFL